MHQLNLDTHINTDYPSYNYVWLTSTLYDITFTLWIGRKSACLNNRTRLGNRFSENIGKLY